jgi:hypothetical protein
VEHEDDDLEPFEGKYDWDEAFAQNPDLPVFDVPTAERERIHGQETQEDAEARVLPGEVEAWLSRSRTWTGTTRRTMTRVAR